ncbi:hypothetical protein BGX23_007611 [Mortierella sp. AD031]|nr:hypothetical protein BGX23_007611 [Mortierella sp. AD031]
MQQRTPQPSTDPIYSLSTASIRARKNALEMENIQRASHLYEDYIAKIKAVSESATTTTPTATTTNPSEKVLLNVHSMEIDSTDPGKNNGSFNLYPNKPARMSPLGDKDFGPIEGLQRMSRSGMLHNLVQQYFTLVHPQFMILHKNQFLFRFWAEYGPFPEAYEIHNQFGGHPGSESTLGEVQEAGSEAASSSLSSMLSSNQATRKSAYRNSPLLLLAMMALVSRHLNNRAPFKSTLEDKHRRVKKSLIMYSGNKPDQIEHKCREKAQEHRLQELMETDEHGQRDLEGENFQDRGEQYFYWATELLKFEYEEPSLTVIQALLLLREYAVMAGGHTQAYMYGGTAITMALVLGWDRAHLMRNSSSGDGQSAGAGFTRGSEEQKVGQEKQQENKAKDEEQRLCWWQCFIVDRWMSAAYNRPVNIPVHVFDKTHLGPPPKIMRMPRSNDDTTTGVKDMEMLLPMGSGLPSPCFAGLPPAPFRAKSFFDQQCRQALLLDDILAFLSTWSDELFVSPSKFEKLSGALDAWYRDLADWQTFPLSGITTTTKSSSSSRPSMHSTQKYATTIPVATLSNGASLACAQSANAMTSLAETLMNMTDATVQPCLLMRHQFSLVTSAGIQLMNANLEDEPRLSTPAKINLLKTIRILRDADRSSFGGSVVIGNGDNGVLDGLHQVLTELFPEQMKYMSDLTNRSSSSSS